MEPSVTTPAASRQAPFTRVSSGFVREIGMGSSVAVNVMTMSLALGVLAVTTVPVSFPGASTVLTTVITGIAVVFPILMYALLAAVMPRSGGDYVYASRSIHPWVGFAASVNATLWYVIFLADLAFLVPQFGLSTAFGNLGVTTGSHTLANWSLDVLKHGWTFGIATASILIVTAIVSLNVRRMLTVVKVLFVFSVIGVVVAFGILLFNSRNDFIAAVSGVGASYSKVISDAHAAGYNGGGFKLGASLLAMPIIFLSFGYAIATAFVGGEVKSPVRDIRGKLYAYAIGVVLVLISVILASKVFGNDFLGSAAYLSTPLAKTYPFAVPANYFFFVGLLTHSTILVAIMGFSFVGAIVALMIPDFWFTTRPLFAWSFDRLIPAKISEVNERTRSPLVATLIVAIIAELYLALMVFSSQSFLKVTSSILLGNMLTFIIVAISAAILPFRRRQLFEASPVPRLVGPAGFCAIGLVSLVVYVFLAIALFSSSALGANSRTGEITLLVIGVIAIVAYPLSAYVNRQRGIDLKLTLRELPPE